MNFSEAAERIWRAGLAAVAPEKLIRNACRRQGAILEFSGIPGAFSSAGPQSRRIRSRVDLSACRDIYLIAFGKAAPAMAAAFLEVLGRRVRDGVVVALPGRNIALPGVRVLEAPHPLPDERSVEAGRAILDLVRNTGPGDLLVLLLSGGGSAQVCLPPAGVTVADKRDVAGALMRNGADIKELNIVRKHLSDIKGGRLAAAAFPAQVVTLALSDVSGDDLEAIASGPAHADSSTFTEARSVMEKYGLWEVAPPPVAAFINRGIAGREPETPKKGHPAFENVVSHIVGNNATALGAARREAETLGFRTMVLTSSDGGEAEAAAPLYVSLLVDLALGGAATGRPLCLLGGGELTVRVTGGGRGGRNQQFVLAALNDMAEQVEALANDAPRMRRAFRENGFLGTFDWLVSSLGTDGIDGTTDAAGARLSPEIVLRARALGLSPKPFLADNDAYPFFERAGGLIVTGPTGTNVMDLRLFLLGP